MAPAQIMTFRPTMEEFQNFSAYIDYIEAQGGHLAGICKVIPPREWVARRTPCDDEHIGDLFITDPIEQRISGKLGVYDMTNYVQEAVTVREYRAESLQLENQPPMGPDNETEDDYKRRIERHFWKNVSFRPAVYGADVNGSLTDTDCTVWNINKLGTVLDRVLAAQKISIRGVNTAYIYYGRYKAAFPWHTEDQDLYSINLIHYGAPKLWYAVPIDSSKRFEALMNTHYPAEHRKCKAFLRHKRFLLSPSILKNHNIPYNTMLHKEGEIMLTFPMGYHAGFNCGFNIAESTNFATERWIPFGMSATHCYCTEDTVNIDMSSFLETYNKDFGGKVDIPADLAEKQDKDEDAAIEALEKYDVDPEIYNELSDESDAAEALVERAQRDDDDYVPNRSDDDLIEAYDSSRRRKLSKRKASQEATCSSSSRRTSLQRPTVVRHRMGGCIKYDQAPASASASRKPRSNIGKSEHLIAGFSVSEAMLIAAGDDDDSGDEDWKTNGDEMAHLRTKRFSSNSGRSSASKSPVRRRRSSPMSPLSKRKPYKFTKRTKSDGRMPAGFVIGSPPKTQSRLQHVDEALECSSPGPSESTKSKSNADKRKRRGATGGRSRKRNKSMPKESLLDDVNDADDEQPSQSVANDSLLSVGDQPLPPTIEIIVRDSGVPAAAVYQLPYVNGKEELPFASHMPPKLISSSISKQQRAVSDAVSNTQTLSDDAVVNAQKRHCGLKHHRDSNPKKIHSNTKVSGASRSIDWRELTKISSATLSVASSSNSKAVLPSKKKSKNVSLSRRGGNKQGKLTSVIDCIETADKPVVTSATVVVDNKPANKSSNTANISSTSGSRDLAAQPLAAPEQKYRPSRMSPIGKPKRKSMLKPNVLHSKFKPTHLNVGAVDSPLSKSLVLKAPTSPENVWEVQDSPVAAVQTPVESLASPAAAKPVSLASLYFVMTKAQPSNEVLSIPNESPSHWSVPDAHDSRKTDIAAARTSDEFFSIENGATAKLFQEDASSMLVPPLLSSATSTDSPLMELSSKAGEKSV